MLGHRVEPKGASHVFILHGSECRKSSAHPTCTFDPRQTWQRKGVMYVINIESVMGTDWKVWLPPMLLHSACYQKMFHLEVWHINKLGDSCNTCCSGHALLHTLPVCNVSLAAEATLCGALQGTSNPELCR